MSDVEPSPLPTLEDAMTQSAANNDASKSGQFNQWGMHSAPFIDSMVDLQKQMLEYAVEMNQVWTTRVQSESVLVTDLVAKLAAARSVPDAATAWQSCMQRQMQLNAEDARRLLDHNERFMRVGAEIFANGGTS